MRSDPGGDRQGEQLLDAPGVPPFEDDHVGVSRAAGDRRGNRPGEELGRHRQAIVQPVPHPGGRVGEHVAADLRHRPIDQLHLVSAAGEGDHRRLRDVQELDTRCAGERLVRREVERTVPDPVGADSEKYSELVPVHLDNSLVCRARRGARASYFRLSPRKGAGSEAYVPGAGDPGPVPELGSGERLGTRTRGERHVRQREAAAGPGGLRVDVRVHRGDRLRGRGGTPHRGHRCRGHRRTRRLAR